MKRNKEEEIKFIEESKKFYYENELNIFAEIKEVYRDAFINQGFSGWSSNLYISPNGYTLTGSMNSGTTTMANFEGEELQILRISSNQDIYDSLDESLDNFERMADCTGIYLGIEKYTKEFLELKQIENEDITIDDLEEYEVEEYVKDQLKKYQNEEYEKVLSFLIHEQIELEWGVDSDLFATKIDMAFDELMDYASSMEE